MKKVVNDINPIINLDYPDPDVIRVGNVYYMVSTTMHFCPGCEILKSYNLVNWEHEAYVYDVIDSTPGQRLEDGKGIYGKGMWAATIRYHKGTFYILFVCNDTHKTYLYRSTDIKGPYKKSNVEGFYHDASLLFDDDGKIYIAYGNRQIYITELNEDMTGPKEGGLHRLAVSDTDKALLGYEGCHFYKINGKYYLFFIHSLEEYWKRVEAVFVSSDIRGEFIGKDCVNDDIGYFNSGVAQGGIVDTPLGNYYAILFQDRGAVGRIPVLLPVSFTEDGVIMGNEGAVPQSFEIEELNEDYIYKPLASSDMFDEFDGPSFGFKSFWQFNHEPDMKLIIKDSEKKCFGIITDRLCEDVRLSKNMLTQRLYYPKTRVSVKVDASHINEGDYAGLCILQYDYAFSAITKEADEYYLVVKKNDDTVVRRKLDSPIETLSFEADFEMGKDEALIEGEVLHKMYFKLEHFVGNRAGLFMYSTKQSGGHCLFSEFTISK